MMQMLNNNVIRHPPPLIIELVGPAGAGKTTLARTLSQRDEKIRVAADLKLRKREHLPVFLSHIPFLLPLILRGSRSSRWFTWDEIKAMVYLRAWPSVLSRQTRQFGTAIILDHGPVFKLATLHAFGPARLKSQNFEQWWAGMFRQWASMLDMVIWLDGLDPILKERINSRHQRHAIKGKSEQEAFQFLARYRTSYAQILTKLTAYGGPQMVQFDTGQTSIERIVDEVLVTCNLKLRDYCR